ncbi:hypothetical protein [Caulobacter sp. UNC279MFTsu5.1]|uniref:hypothetical protein n=1 Tax=Caulobacter sp. UNC279MFTsu5.1 TaxID=1502775 RepID=UPI000374D666|nr:hypothetical protein [Caulobacter sp. UNC279MFTsu5.1]
MKSLTRKIGDWVASILVLTGVGMFLWAFGNRHQTAREWAQEAGVDLSTWLQLAAVFLIGGLCLLAITRLSDRK